MREGRKVVVNKQGHTREGCVGENGNGERNGTASRQGRRQDAGRLPSHTGTHNATAPHHDRLKDTGAHESATAGAHTDDTEEWEATTVTQAGAGGAPHPNCVSSGSGKPAYGTPAVALDATRPAASTQRKGHAQHAAVSWNTTPPARTRVPHGVIGEGVHHLYLIRGLGDAPTVSEEGGGSCPGKHWRFVRHTRRVAPQEELDAEGLRCGDRGEGDACGGLRGGSSGASQQRHGSQHADVTTDLTSV